MINTDYFTRKPIHRLVDYLYDIELKHFQEELMSNWDLYEPDYSTMDDTDLFNFAVENNLEHIWLDCYMVRNLITEDDEDDD